MMRKSLLLVGLACIVGAVVLLSRRGNGPHPAPTPAPVFALVTNPPLPPPDTGRFTFAGGNNSASPWPELGSVRRYSFAANAHELTEQEKARFTVDLDKKYKPVLSNWLAAYAGRVPFEIGDVSLDTFCGWGGSSNAHTYTFVLKDGVTLTIADSKYQNATYVCDLNAPKQSSLLMELPTDGRSPIMTMPITRADIIDMVERDSGYRYTEGQIRMGPTGLSGSLNGGAHVEIGGNPNNAASWEYSFVFGPDGKLAIYSSDPFAPRKRKGP